LFSIKLIFLVVHGITRIIFHNNILCIPNFNTVVLLSLTNYSPERDLINRLQRQLRLPAHLSGSNNISGDYSIVITTIIIILIKTIRYMLVIAILKQFQASRIIPRMRFTVFEIFEIR